MPRLTCASNTRNASSSTSSRSRSSQPATRGRKRKSTESNSLRGSKRGKKDDGSSSTSTELELTPNEAGKPRLTTPDLEFDYDRTQLRNQRPTPGRVARPRYEEYDLPEGFKEQFYVPAPVKKKGRLNAFEKDELYRQGSLLDPSAIFHVLNVCHRKGRKVGGMEKALERHAREEREIFGKFFVDGVTPAAERHIVLDYVKDHVSKDLGIPWHQIVLKHFVEWEEKGFPKQKADEWWKPPNKEEKRRMSKMQSGSTLRKDL
ncbi:uncharacterized protein F4822DRAFT_432246 [Hypoxylon trugodes]|uniref:uncharacterized protein n=1 Tax=Hypoxylon trugodes TaxID=326681 RepID=UPI0021994028|nr:uncharacterized protein F4822DRAFT_432246 [Hypoxylon trugodes]KAI1385395.1 hypothetical protein F4822DRAFT_432246 [Hypoxylon trugodes]